MDDSLYLPDPRLPTLKDWLVEAGGTIHDGGEVLTGLAEQLVALGVPLARASTHIQTIHSERTGIGRVWRRGRETTEQHYGFGPEVERAYNASPLKTVRETQGWVELRPPHEDPDRYSVLPDLTAEGITHYLIGPLAFSDGTVNAATFATNEPVGFAPGDVELIKALMPTYTRMLELKTVRRMLNEVLSIYVGREPGGRILAGHVRRGDVVGLSAAMLLADLRGFTVLSNRLKETELVDLLNAYFNCIVPAVIAEGGEVLKFVGDAVLAIFPQPEGEAPMKAPRLRALAAADASLAEIEKLNGDGRFPLLKAGIALHQGRVAYGNVGAAARQDFTVIGRDVNLVSRLAQLCGRTHESMLLSEPFARGLQRPLRELGPFRLKGFPEKQRVFAPVAA